MKRVRHEQINLSVHHYLKRRQFLDHESSQKKDSRWAQTISDMAVNNASNGEITVDNLLTYSSISGDASSCDEQFSRLKAYINKGSEPYRSQLLPLLYPLFVHLYLDQLCNGHKTPAHRFYSKHLKLFENEKSFTHTLESIHKLYNQSDVSGCLEATDFRENKFKIKLSEEALEYLLRHLKHEDNSTIYQIFNQHIKLENTVDNEAKGKLDLTEGLSTTKEESFEIKEDPEHLEAMSALQLSIRQVREGPPCLPSICFYTFINAYQGLCTVDISPDKTLISAGFEDASIKLWSTTPSLLQSTPQTVDPCKLYIAADYWNVDVLEESKPRYTETVTLRAHSGSVYKTCFSTDSKHLLSASEDATVRLWDMSTHTNKVCYKGHNAPIWDLDVGSIGGYFASSSQDRTAKLWVSDRIYPVRTFAGHNLDVDCVKFHPNCNYLATGSSDRSVRLWTLQDGKSVRLMHGHRGTIMTLTFSPNGNYLASAGEDKRIRVWDLSSGQLYKELKGHTDTIHSLSFSGDSTLLASGGMDCTIKVWDIRKGVASSSSHSDGISSPELLGSFSAKSAVVTYLQYSEHNVLRGAGAV
uniref:TFIID subunit TAF5 NTD2 domain-containing protein n=1 Tax=Magallana gigas TaxID=29159 RepID=A0A8W8NMP8_MAGGI|nr:TAF5-like RNA polymerase II p300/CBP-associated factor-associated factor 65 kDa subunit 5L [Crassostrea gigas]